MSPGGTLGDGGGAMVNQRMRRHAVAALLGKGTRWRRRRLAKELGQIRLPKYEDTKGYKMCIYIERAGTGRARVQEDVKLDLNAK
jgi:hypothetical protein